MGFDSILGYQKKISGGGADLATSREVHRLGTRLDFFRLMSFYHGGECCVAGSTACLREIASVMYLL